MPACSVQWAHDQRTVGNWYRRSPATSDTATHRNGEQAGSGYRVHSLWTLLFGALNGLTTSANSWYPSPTRAAPSPTPIWKWPQCSSSTWSLSTWWTSNMCTSRRGATTHLPCVGPTNLVPPGPASRVALPEHWPCPSTPTEHRPSFPYPLPALKTLWQTWLRTHSTVTQLRRPPSPAMITTSYTPLP